MKKIYPLALVLALSLTACGSEDSSTEKDGAKDNAQKTEVTTTNNTETTPEETKSESSKTETGNKLYADGYSEDVPAVTNGQAELSQASYDFLVENSGLIPAKDEAAITEVKNQAKSEDIKLLNKSIDPYNSSFVTYEGYVVQIEEQTYDNGEVISWLNIFDESSGGNHNVIMYKSSGDILEEDYVQFWGVPLAKYSYETLDGGFQNTILFAGAHAEKK